MHRALLTLLASLLVLAILVGPVVAQGDGLIGPESYPPGVNPLTGLPVEDASVLEQRPMIVKIVNAPAEARPQWGIPQADIVWEYLIAGGLTRFAAVYLSQAPERVGPIRSLRLTDFELARVYRALVTASGMSIGTYDVLKSDALMLSRIVSGSSPCPPLCRDEDLDRKWELTLMGDLQGLRDLAEELERDTAAEPVIGMAFSDDLPPGGAGVERIAVRYRNTTVTYSYDADANVWLRSQDGEPHTDAVTGDQLQMDNVIILEDEHWVQPYNYEGYWGYSNFAYSTNLIGEGRALVLRDGQYIEARWQRATRDDGLHFVTVDGDPLPLKPGRTFVNLMPRWIDGYELELYLSEPVIGVVNTPSVYLRRGPSTNYGQAGWAYGGDELSIVGRNNGGTWLQVIVEDGVRWISADFVDVADGVFAVPLVRPTLES